MNWNWNKPITKDNKQYVKELCKKWRKNKLKNPITNHAIQQNKGTYTQIQKICSSSDMKSSPINVDLTSTHITKTDITSSKITHNNDIIDTNRYFPDINEDNFPDKIQNLEEFAIYRQKQVKILENIEDFKKQSINECPSNSFDKAFFQYFVSQYLSLRTPYKNILLYYSVGVGKTCSAVSIAEGFLKNHSSFDEELIWVILPKSLKSNFFNTIYDFSLFRKNQCTDDTYLKLAKISKDIPLSDAKNKILKIIKQRYKILTYGEFVKISQSITLNNKIIIVDEAHNLRNKVLDDDNDIEDIDIKDFKIYDALRDVIQKGTNNRLIMMSGTPMYNKPDEIIELLNLFLLNDKQELIKIPKLNKFSSELKSIIAKYSSKYISYITNDNPFTYAFRLSFHKSIKDIQHLPKNIQNPQDYQWVSNIQDGVILTELGSQQIHYINTHFTSESMLSSFNQMNIVYENNTIGKTGFNNTFHITNQSNSLNITYKNIHNPIFHPDYIHKYASKIHSISNNIQNTEGIIIIYSRFLWSGVIPMAIALEHLGFNRYGVSNNILDYPNIQRNKGNYVLLTSFDPLLTGKGSISFDNLIHKINSPDNINGNKIKIVLITQKASEGISFSNVRSIHVLEPWWHVNRTEQIIGRGIRRCSHINLPLEKRNTTVFLYCAYMKDNKTSDVHTFEIASNKIHIIKQITNVIRDNSIDCSIHKNINFYSPDLFKFKTITITDCYNTSFDYKIGSKHSFTCHNTLSTDNRGVRDTTMNITHNLVKKITKFIIHTKTNWIPIDDIFHHVKTYEGDNSYFYYALHLCLYPLQIIPNKKIFLHQNGIQIIEDTQYTENTINIIDEQKENKKFSFHVIDNLQRLSQYKTRFERLFHSYRILKNTIFHDFFQTLLNSHDFDTLINDFISQGLILPQKQGYIDIFQDEYYALLPNGNDMNQDLFETIRKKMKKKTINKDSQYGLFVIEFDKKSNTSSPVFKLFLNNSKHGASCFNKNKQDLIKFFGSILNDTMSRDDMCFHIAKYLYDNNKLLFLPFFAPHNK